MVKCEISGKEFKDSQGLAGRMRFKRGGSSGESTRESPAGADKGGQAATGVGKNKETEGLNPRSYYLLQRQL